ncbi:Gp37 protein [Desulfonatronum thiosulfatophilum]|uniref:Gp37 protein n=1 Tax=Desulfonatronum thiosulfatophilum TaxID=617002 RepID=A0A1G6A6F1_9BACT|nr:Gp37 family protein [Desulfonatronum thiosulfatophilum]SDB03989.1 Gp37 protein [Desulfonatronum thiosulfatophilum]
MGVISEIEDQILKILRADDLHAGVKIGSLPLGRNSERIFTFGRAAVWVCYAGSRYGKPQTTSLHVQSRSMRWSVLVLALNYRGDVEAADDALPLLEAVIDSLAGEEVGGNRLSLETDGLIETGKPGIVGYEAMFALDAYLRR